MFFVVLAEWTRWGQCAARSTDGTTIKRLAQKITNKNQQQQHQQQQQQIMAMMNENLWDRKKKFPRQSNSTRKKIRKRGLEASRNKTTLRLDCFRCGNNLFRNRKWRVQMVLVIQTYEGSKWLLDKSISLPSKRKRLNQWKSSKHDIHTLMHTLTHNKKEYLPRQ